MRHRVLFAVLAGSLALKLAIWLAVASTDPGRFSVADSGKYHGTARALLVVRSFAVSPEFPGVPQTFRTLGYPAFLASVYAIGGIRPAAAGFVQILLSLVTIALTYGLADRLWGSRVAGLAALLLALDPVSLYYSLMLLAETLFALFVVLMLTATARAFDTPRRGAWSLAGGLALALATLTRPTTYYLVVPVLLGLLAWGLVAKLGARTVARMLVLFALPSLLLVGGWQLRNYFRTGHSEFSQVEGLNALFYRGAGILMLRDGIDKQEARRRLISGPDSAELARIALSQPKLDGWATQHPELGLGGRWKAQAARLALRHPLLLIRVQLAGILHMMAGTGQESVLELLRGEVEPTSPLGDLVRLTPRDYFRKWVAGSPLDFWFFTYAGTLLALTYVAAAAWGIVALVQRKLRVVDLLAWGVLAYLILASAGPEADARFRVPMMPVLAAYAAAGLGILFGTYRSPAGRVVKA